MHPFYIQKGVIFIIGQNMAPRMGYIGLDNQGRGWVPKVVIIRYFIIIFPCKSNKTAIFCNGRHKFFDCLTFGSLILRIWVTTWAPLVSKWPPAYWAYLLPCIKPTSYLFLFCISLCRYLLNSAAFLDPTSNLSVQIHSSSVRFISFVW